MFAVLQKYGGVRAARIITDSIPRISRVRLWCISRALQRGVPVAKIVHNKWFYGLPFYTNKYTLDPRPDTETLVSAVLADNATNSAPTVLDLGTGTGCIIAAIAKNIPSATGVGMERSFMARRVARKNIKKLGLGNRIKIIYGNFNKKNQNIGKFNIIVSNPPYIAFGDCCVDAGAKHDPKCALYADNNGFAAYYALAKNAQNWITDGGKIYLEIGIGMENKVREIFTNMGWKYIRAETDLGGITRVLVFTK